ncbi:hypothetical protein BpHYR1_019661 [Brachionus plicatilis]|uniref:Uncharacterized protein n=1 Tax=Brachionus plicatilis TaxID=10195 RepID=A0A3M7PDS4_BRAPC|nr:hypothetical protein BpHYR1_019661 [Brachionus plicatilis]
MKLKHLRRGRKV